MSSSSRNLINRMEETQNPNSYGTKVKPKQSNSFREESSTRHKYAEDHFAMIKKKFKKSKEHVNADLVKFTQDSIVMLEKTTVSNPELRASMENILRIADECAKMSTDEFWYKCESIVQELDDQRKELPNGVLKRAYTNLLFILTRCTRLVQASKEDTTHNQEFWFLNAENFKGR